MFKKRLIPKLQMKSVEMGGRTRMVLVTTRGFSEVFQIGDPVSQARIYQAQVADELVFLDLDATAEGRGAMVQVVEQAAEEIFMPITVGGGVRRVEDFRRMLNSGADKVAVNTWAVESPGLIEEAAGQFGAQCVVLSIDFRRGADGACRVFTHAGTRATQWNPVAWAQQGEALGAGEILLTSIDRDGSRQGLDLALVREVAGGVSIPVIASGGCGKASHFVEGFVDGRADAVAAGTYFCFKDENPMQTRSRIANAGIPIRLHQ